MCSSRSKRHHREAIARIRSNLYRICRFRAWSTSSECSRSWQAKGRNRACMERRTEPALMKGLSRSRRLLRSRSRAGGQAQWDLKRTSPNSKFLITTVKLRLFRCQRSIQLSHYKACWQALIWIKARKSKFHKLKLKMVYRVAGSSSQNWVSDPDRKSLLSTIWR